MRQMVRQLTAADLPSKVVGRFEGDDLQIGPPRRLIAAVVQFQMMLTA
jgi:hypothetical protein